MKLESWDGKFVLTEAKLKQLYLFIFEQGFQNGILVEAGIGTDDRMEKLSEFINTQEKTVKQKKQLSERKLEFGEKLKEYVEKFGRDLVKEFYNYWTEHNEGGKQMRFEFKKNQPFNIERRLTTFKTRETQRNQQYIAKKEEKKQTTLDKYRSTYDRIRDKASGTSQDTGGNRQNDFNGESGVVDAVATEV